MQMLPATRTSDIEKLEEGLNNQRLGMNGRKKLMHAEEEERARAMNCERFATRKMRCSEEMKQKRVSCSLLHVSCSICMHCCILTPSCVSIASLLLYSEMSHRGACSCRCSGCECVLHQARRSVEHLPSLAASPWDGMSVEERHCRDAGRRQWRRSSTRRGTARKERLASAPKREVASTHGPVSSRDAAASEAFSVIDAPFASCHNLANGKTLAALMHNFLKSSSCLRSDGGRAGGDVRTILLEIEVQQHVILSFFEASCS